MPDLFNLPAVTRLKELLFVFYPVTFFVISR